jgi:hypothetical protein
LLRLKLLVSLSEPVDASCRIDDFLLARVKRMALRADFDVDVVGRRTGRKLRAAGAHDFDVAVGWMNTFFHLLVPPY